ncbi:hypothetical protein NHX12_015006 [Muraenolepis orangiensis]|uniref:ADP-ribosylation factor-like protein 6-interacting protein 6 n=1 Tax=Muraenolepis orangiensis TaxID=630683 RepID=A0A9Q0D9W6_9TELE|nr:hypothetical protein NHX12_015006 [Muraenolepis orangiensis]
MDTTKTRWSVVLLSTVCSAFVVLAAGVLCALFYPILTELRGERVRAEDGTEVSMLGFWSILMLSVSAGCICCAFSWTLTFLDSYTPGTLFLPNFRPSRAPGPPFDVGYAVALLNGVTASLAVVWTLS